MITTQSSVLDQSMDAVTPRVGTFERSILGYIAFLALFAIALTAWFGIQFNPNSTLSIIALSAAIIALLLTLVSVIFARKQRWHVTGIALVTASLLGLVAGICGLPTQRAVWFGLALLPVLSGALLLNPRWVLGTLVASLAIVWVVSYTLLTAPTAQEFNDWLGLSIATAVLGIGLVVLARLRMIHQEQQTQSQQTIAELKTSMSQQEKRHAIAQVDLEQVQHRLNTLMVAATDGVVLTDEQGTITHSNALAPQLLGEPELNGKRINQWMRDSVGRYRVISRERDNDRVLTTIEMLNDAKTVLLITQIPIRNTTGAVLGTVGFIRNQTRTADIEQMHSEFLDLLTRDMRNPLTTILSAEDTLLASSIGEKNELILHAARRSTTRLLDLVNTLLDMDRLQTDPAVLHLVNQQLRPLIETSIAHATPQAQQRSINLVLEYGADAGVIAFDAQRMQRVMLNLLDNAISNSPVYSTVRVQVTQSNGVAQVRISDQGANITPEDAQRLFDRFSRSVENQRSGSLGLAFCKLVIEAHRGQLWVETNPGKGTTFAFNLPTRK